MESQETTSPSVNFASSTARAVLPEAVGPTTQMILSMGGTLQGGEQEEDGQAQQYDKAGQGQEEQQRTADQGLQGEHAGVLVLVIGILEEVEQKEARHQRADQKQKEIAEGHFDYLLFLCASILT